ncbi:MAG TPA: HEAT repeat domain-containing protein, partial [Kofleriaceae bacterium]
MTSYAAYGSWVERLEAIAVGREVLAVAGRRDVLGTVAPSSVHVVPTSLLEGKGRPWQLEAGGAIRALAFAGDDLLIGGGDDGALIAWDVTGKVRVAQLALGAAIQAIALDGGVAHGDGVIAVGTADGALHLVRSVIANATPAWTVAARHALSEGALGALAWDPAGLWLAGGADGQLWVIGSGAPRAVSPGGDGGIRAIVSLGDGRAAIGCGDGGVRLCYVVGDVEATDRSGDHGHQAAVRGLVLGPAVTDDAGRELPRRLFSAGEDGAIKAWLVDGNRRPRTIELGIGPASALAFAPGSVVKPVAVDKAVGRLWIASTERNVAALALGPEVEPVGEPVVLGSTLGAIAGLLRDGKAAVKVKLEMLDALAGLAEDEARALLDLALASGPPEVRIAATRAMVRSGRKASRPALRAALDAEPKDLRIAAFTALRALETEQPLAAVRAGLAVRHEDIRIAAVEALIPL